MKKQLVAMGIAAAVGVTGLTGFSVANATTDSAASNDPMSGLVDAIATKFNLKEADVQAVFDTQHDAMQAEREASVKVKIAQLVTDGKITQAQADKINEKRAELQAEREAAKDSGKTREEMKTEMGAKRTELKAWAEENDIEQEYLRYVMGGGHGQARHGHGGPGGFGGRHSETDDKTESNS